MFYINQVESDNELRKLMCVFSQIIHTVEDFVVVFDIFLAACLGYMPDKEPAD